MQRRAVIILGMHRSGTSAVTRAVNLMGVELSDRLLPPEPGSNETGFWEHADVVALHDDVMAELGRAWEDVRALPPHWEKRRDLASFKDRLARILARDFEGATLWGVKDPRLCLLMPMWTDVLADFESTAHYLLVHRNPIEVARSIEAREGLPEPWGILMWLRHVLAAELHSRGAPRVFVAYDAVMGDWRATVARIGAGLGIAWPRTADEVAGEMAGFIRPGLRHHAVDDQAFMGNDELSVWVRETYGALRALEQGEDAAALATLERVRAEIAPAERLYGAVAGIQAGLVVRLRERITHLNEVVADREDRVTDRDTRIQERDGMLAHRDAALAEHQKQVLALSAELEHVREERQATFEKLNRYIHSLEEHNKDIEELHRTITRSTSWRITAPLRGAGIVAKRVLDAIKWDRLVRTEAWTEIVPQSDIHIEMGHYRAVGFDPYFAVVPREDRLPIGWVKVSLVLHGEDKIMQPILYYDAGDGYDETTRVYLPRQASGRVRKLLRLPARVDSLRFDPCKAPGVFRIENFRIRAVGRIELAATLIWQQLRPALTQPGKLLRGLWRGGLILRSSGVKGLARALISRELVSASNYHDWVELYDTIDDSDRSDIRKAMAGFARRPKFSIILPTWNTPERYLRAAIESVTRQLYADWELCIADDASTEPHVRKVLEEYAARDPRIKLVLREKNGHISAASNSALGVATGDYVVLLDHDDMLAEHALYMVADDLQRHPDADLVYSDEDKIDQAGARFLPHFKTAWNPEMLRSVNYVGHLAVLRRSLVQEIGGFREGFEGSQDYDLLLRFVERTDARRIRHLPHVLYHWRAVQGSTAGAEKAKNYAYDAAIRALDEHFERTKVTAKAEPASLAYHYRARYALPDPAPKVSVIVPTRDKVDLLRMSVGGLLERTDYPNLEVIVMDNGSSRAETHAYFAELKKEPRARVIRWDQPFNFSAINNAGAKLATGEVLCLLNNDIDPINPDWLSEMVSHAIRADIGAVGARLYYPDGMIQHAGVVVGMGGVAGHIEKRLPPTQSGYFGRVQLLQDYSAVTAACLVVRKSVYDEVGGLDEENLTVAFNDVDFCLRVDAAGYRNVYTPYAELYHHESASRGTDLAPGKMERFQAEVLYMKRRWGDRLMNDPYFNPNLSLDFESVAIAFPPRVAKPWRLAAPVAAAAE
jgi:GT2 family glycosyltransferase